MKPRFKIYFRDFERGPIRAMVTDYEDGLQYIEFTQNPIIVPSNMEAFFFLKMNNLLFKL